MKFKRLYLIITVLLLGIVHYNYGIFTRYNYFVAQWDKHNANVRILTYGEPLLADKQQKVIATRMGFEITSIAGCVISQSEANGAAVYNSVMTSALNKRLGSDWKRRFDKAVDSLFRLESAARIYEGVTNDPSVKEMGL